MSSDAVPLRELVVCSLEPWDQVWRRNQLLVHRLLELEPHLRVLFVAPPVDTLLEIRRRRRPGRGEGMRRPYREGALSRLVTLQPTKWLPRALGPFADRALAREVERAARSLGFSAPLLWVNDPAAALLAQRTGWPLLYDVTDDWLLAECLPRERRRRFRNEALLLRVAREVVVCSPSLAETKGRYRRVRLVTNGVDAAWARSPAPRPGDLPAGPIACYVGTLHEDRLDLELCLELARQVQGRGTLVLVGPDALRPASRARLAGEPGVLLTGARPHAEVPAYLQHADVLIVPHRRSPFTESLDPIKAYEYRAVGRPVVATPVAGFREAGEPVVVAEGSGFVAAVLEQLPADPAPPSLLPLPSELPTWDAQGSAMRAALRSLVGERPH